MALKNQVKKPYEYMRLLVLWKFMPFKETMCALPFGYSPSSKDTVVEKHISCQKD
jgi:hypothetical protein